MVDLNYIVETNADEESWLPALLQEITAENPGTPRSKAILMLAEVIARLTLTGSVGVFSYVPSDKSDKGKEVDPGAIGSVLSIPENWEYGKITQPVYALFTKRNCQPDGAANGTQPFSSETNGTSPTADSRR